MNDAGSITMTMRALDRLKVIQQVVDCNLKPGQAGSRLGLSVRQVRRLVRRYEAQGATGLVSRRCNRPSNHHIDEELAQVALMIVRECYADFGPTLACEKLRELHGIDLSKETVRKLMSAVGLWIPRSQRPARIYQPRNRRHCLGELVQIDGSDHHWFEDRGAACSLLVYVDDATSQLLQLHFTRSESTFSYFKATRAYIEQHGKPQAFYCDKYSVFRVNRKNAAGGHGHTQFGRALFELNIEGICANSSQAKGRVERANLTLQDRLVKELRLQGISTMSAANAYVPVIIADYNRRFAKPARNDFDTHRAVRPDEILDLIFTVREPRRVSHSLTVQYDKMLYLLTDTPASRRLIGKYIDVDEYPDGRIEPRADGAALPYIAYNRLSEISNGAIVENERLGHVLQIAQLVQDQRDNRPSKAAPSRSHRGIGPISNKLMPDKKSQRSLAAADIAVAIEQLAKRKANGPLAEAAE